MKLWSILAMGVLLAISVLSPGVLFEASEPGPVPARSHAGISVPSAIASLSAEQSGTIVDMPLAEGLRVVKDQVAFKLSSRLQQLEVERLRALAESELPMQRARAELDYADQEAQRFRELTSKQIVSDSTLQDRELDRAMAELKVDQADMDRQQAVNAYEQAKERLAQRTVHAPFSGIVTKWLGQPGETAEELIPVIEIVSLDPLWIEFDCPIQEQADFALGNKIQVSPATRPEETRTAEVVYVSMRADASSHTFLVRAAVPNDDYSWKAGLKMLVRASNDTEERGRGK